MATLRPRLRRHQRRNHRHLHPRRRGRRLHPPRRRDRLERCRVGDGVLTQTAVVTGCCAAGEYVAADDQWHCAGGPDADGVERHLVGDAAVGVLVSVAALRRGRGGVHGDRRCDRRSTYVVAQADVDATLRVAVTASNGSSVYASAVGGDAPRSYWRFRRDERGAGRPAGAGGRQLRRLAAARGERSAHGRSRHGGDVQRHEPVRGRAGRRPGRRRRSRSSSSCARRSCPTTGRSGRRRAFFTGWWLNTGPFGGLPHPHGRRQQLEVRPQRADPQPGHAPTTSSPPTTARTPAST